MQPAWAHPPRLLIEGISCTAKAAKPKVKAKAEAKAKVKAKAKAKAKAEAKAEAKAKAEAELRRFSANIQSAGLFSQIGLANIS